MNWPHGIGKNIVWRVRNIFGKIQVINPRQSTIAFMLSWSKKLIENDDINIDTILMYYDKNTYIKIMTAATTRFLGFTEGIESLLFIRIATADGFELKPDHNKLLLILKTLCDSKSRPSHKNNKPVIQHLINLYSDRCVHTTLYVMYALGKNCFKNSMNFCRSHDTRTLGIFTRIAADLSKLRKAKLCLLQKLASNDKMTPDLIASTLQTRDEMFDYTDIDELKTCVMKVAELRAIRQIIKSEIVVLEDNRVQESLFARHIDRALRKSR